MRSRARATVVAVTVFRFVAAPSYLLAGAVVLAATLAAVAGATARRPRKRRPQTQAKRSARQERLSVALVEPWSVMRFSLVVWLAAFVILFAAVTVLYRILAGLGLFDSVQRASSRFASRNGLAGADVKSWFSESRILGYTAILGSLNVVLLTAISTIGAQVFNLTSQKVGGVKVTLREKRVKVDPGCVAGSADAAGSRSAKRGTRRPRWRIASGAGAAGDGHRARDDAGAEGAYALPGVPCGLREREHSLADQGERSELGRGRDRIDG